MSGSRLQDRFSCSSFCSDQSQDNKSIPNVVRFDGETSPWLTTYNDRKLGQGSFGSVYLGEYNEGQASSLVAVKFSNNSDDDSSQVEYSILNALKEKKSPYLVNLINYRCDDGQSIMVIDYMPKGSLGDFIDSHSSCSWKKRFQILVDSISGLSDMHEMGYLHRDIKPDNVLLNPSLRAKLCDFGVSCKEGTDEANEIAGTPLTAAPEVLNGAAESSEMRCTRKSDIYSFGVVLLEVAIWSRESTPRLEGTITKALFDEFASAWLLRLQILNQMAEDLCPTDIAHLIRDCTQEDSKSRPAVEKVRDRLIGMSKIHGEVRQVFFNRQSELSKLGYDTTKGASCGGIAGLIREYAEEEKYSPRLK